MSLWQLVTDPHNKYHNKKNQFLYLVFGKLLHYICFPTYLNILTLHLVLAKPPVLNEHVMAKVTCSRAPLLYLVGQGDVEFVGDRQEGPGCHRSHIIIHILKPLQNCLTHHGKEHR